jgi:hypothetical protein
MKKQTRRTISVKGTTYNALRDDCATRNVSMSDHLERLIAADREARGLTAGAPPPPAPPPVQRPAPRPEIVHREQTAPAIPVRSSYSISNGQVRDHGGPTPAERYDPKRGVSGPGLL